MDYGSLVLWLPRDPAVLAWTAPATCSATADWRLPRKIGVAKVGGPGLAGLVSPSLPLQRQIGSALSGYEWLEEAIGMVIYRGLQFRRNFLLSLHTAQSTMTSLS